MAVRSGVEVAVGQEVSTVVVPMETMVWRWCVERRIGETSVGAAATCGIRGDREEEDCETCVLGVTLVCFFIGALPLMWN